MKKILITLIAIALSISAFSQTRARTGLTVGDHKVSGTNIVVQDSTTTDPDGKLTFFIGGSSDTASLHINAADQIDLNTIYVKLLPDTTNNTHRVYVPVLTDAGNNVFCDSLFTAIELPIDATVAIPVGSTITFYGRAGLMKFSVEGGGSLRAAQDSVTSDFAGSVVGAYKEAANKWWIYGQLTN